jgi:hypothetical protein
MYTIQRVLIHVIKKIQTLKSLNQITQLCSFHIKFLPDRKNTTLKYYEPRIKRLDHNSHYSVPQQRSHTGYVC